MRTTLLIALGLLVGAIVLGLASTDTTLDGVAYLMFGIAGVLAVASAFYAVGRSEDRARERERDERR
jgi:membrane protein implicated in regulation of membrane protease activity